MSPYDISSIDQHCFVFVNGVWEGTLLFYNKNKYSTSVARATPVSAGFKHKISNWYMYQWNPVGFVNNTPKCSKWCHLVGFNGNTNQQLKSKSKHKLLCQQGFIHWRRDRQTSVIGRRHKKRNGTCDCEVIDIWETRCESEQQKNNLYSPHTFLSHITEPQSCLLYDIAIFIFTAHLGSWIIGKLTAAKSLPASWWARVDSCQEQVIMRTSQIS